MARFLVASVLTALLDGVFFVTITQAIYRPANGWTHLAIWMIQDRPRHPDPYPEGWFCTPRGTYKNGQQTTEHPCRCQRMDHDPQCEGLPIEDLRCEQWCHAKHCNCPIKCVPVEQTGC